jgi:MFS family permease
LCDAVDTLKNREPAHLHLTLPNRLSYGLGGAVYAVKEAAYIMFVLLFYTQVLGLSGTATGIVLSLSLLWDAVTDPMVGSWSDRYKRLCSAVCAAGFCSGQPVMAGELAAALFAMDPHSADLFLDPALYAGRGNH